MMIYSIIKVYHILLLMLSLVLSLFSQHLCAKELTAINFGVLSLSPPSKTYKNWKPFADYLAKKINLPINIVAPRGFGKLKKMIEAKKVDIFYINSHIFYLLKQKQQALALAQMENIANSTTSHSSIFVRSDSEITDISQLKGKTFAFVSPMGAGGYLAPRAYLYQQGLQSKTQTKEIFTKNLTNSIYNVLLGKADAATMCGVNYQLMSKKVNIGELKIIATSEAYPENVVASRVDISAGLIKQLTTLITSMPKNKEGQKILKNMAGMKIKQFIPYNSDIEKLTQYLLKTGKFGG